MQKLAFIGAALALFGASGASAASPETNRAAQTTIDRGFLTTSSPEFILRVDLRSGQANLTRLADPGIGKPFSFAMSADPGTLANIDFMVLGAATDSNPDLQPVTRAGTCANESSNVTTAATLVSNTCTGGGPATLACTSAITAFDNAVDAFRDCIRAFSQMK
jgi:hypothetical protein